MRFISLMWCISAGTKALNYAPHPYGPGLEVQVTDVYSKYFSSICKLIILELLFFHLQLVEVLSATLQD